MSYNLANQMTAANGFSFTYDGFNRRVKSAKSGSTAYYHYSQDGKLLFSESNGVWKNYIYIGSRLIAKDSSSSTSFIHTDILGSTTAQSNSSGTLINNSRRHYKPFGDTYETASNEIGYAGHKFDSELGLSYMQARYYDPVIGVLRPSPRNRHQNDDGQMNALFVNSSKNCQIIKNRHR